MINFIILENLNIKKNNLLNIYFSLFILPFYVQQVLALIANRHLKIVCMGFLRFD